MGPRLVGAREGDGTGALVSSSAASDATGAGSRVLIVEEYIPEYRRRFFEMLEGALDAESIQLRIAVGLPASALAAKADAVADMPHVWSVPAPSVSIAGRRLTYKRLSKLVADTDLVVVDPGLRHLENLPLLLRRGRGPRVALWGHATLHVKRPTRARRLMERIIARSADWFFAYTQGDAERVAASGYPTDRITVVQNTVDVRELTDMRNDVSADQQRLLRDELGLPAQNICLYIGELRASKRIEFLLEACSMVARRLPEFTLIVAGNGPQRALIEEYLARPWLRYVGRATGRKKAALGVVSDILVMPGAVGLVAVDSFALQTPIVTTRSPYHGPEVEYLEDGLNARFSGDSVTEFAQTVEQTLLARDELTLMQAACAAAARQYSLESMVAKFAEGVRAALRAPHR